MLHSMRLFFAGTKTALLMAAFTLPLCAVRAHGQLAHEGPVKAIARSKTLPAYDVVSVKLNNTGDDSGSLNIDDHGIFTVKNMPLESILEFAYDVKSDQIVGLTGPVGSARFNVEAKVLPSGNGAPPLLPDANLQAMLIPMLADRFHLKAHLEPKVMPVYDLVVARGGLKIKLSQDEIHDSTWNINGESTDKVLSGKGNNMTDLADELSDEVHRRVVDKTGLTGHADITLKWSDEVAVEQGGNTISIFTALEEQLGLRLESAKGPVDTLVIDHVEMPTED
jgi:bla regulator protein BlaR1